MATSFSPSQLLSLSRHLKATYYIPSPPRQARSEHRCSASCQPSMQTPSRSYSATALVKLKVSISLVTRRRNLSPLAAPHRSKERHATTSLNQYQNTPQSQPPCGRWTSLRSRISAPQRSFTSLLTKAKKFALRTTNCHYLTTDTSRSVAVSNGVMPQIRAISFSQRPYVHSTALLILLSLNHTILYICPEKSKPCIAAMLSVS